MKSLVLILLLAAIPAEAQVVAPKPKPWKDKAWLTLAVASQGMTTWDVEQTLAKKRAGWREDNPLIRPIVNGPDWGYRTFAQTETVGASWLGWKMKRSKRWYRHIWWLPQGLQLGGAIYGISSSRGRQQLRY